MLLSLLLVLPFPFLLSILVHSFTPCLCSLSPFAKKCSPCFFLSAFLLAPVALTLSDYSVALSKSNYMCLITSRAIKPLVRGARRSSLMMTIKKGGSEREKERGQEGREAGVQVKN